VHLRIWRKAESQIDAEFSTGATQLRVMTALSGPSWPFG
jgi:hypothetical protein